VADDLSVRLEELAKMVRDLQKNMDEFMKSAGGVKMVMGAEERKPPEEENIVVQ
jgi:succinate dehydrogenase/fumarate reductase-like Fe-S protein